MPKAIGIDYGSKRIGIAISDSSSLIASPLCTVSNQEIFKFLRDLFKNEDVNCIVVGEAKSLDGSKTDSSIPIERIIKKLISKYPKLKIETIDERFTSKIAEKSIIDAGIKLKKRRNKELINEVSATIILQDYLSYRI